MLPTDAARRQWIAGMYQSRLWASPGTFSRADVDFMTEPFADEARLRAGWSAYQLGHGRPMTEPPLLGGTVDVPTLLLYGTDDHVVGEDFVLVLRARVHRPHRPAAHPRRRPLPPVGARRHLQPARGERLRRPVGLRSGDREIAR